MESLRRSFKSHSSFKQMRKITAGRAQEQNEKQPILSDHDGQETDFIDSGRRGEVVVKIDGNNDGGSSEKKQ